MSYLVLWERIDKYFKQHGMITFIVLCMFILLFYLTYQVSNHLPTEIREVKIELKEDIKELKNGQDMIINHLLNKNKKGQ